jgi:hypothetical protein
MTVIKINAITVPADTGMSWHTASLRGPKPSTTPMDSRVSSCSSRLMAGSCGWF